MPRRARRRRLSQGNLNTDSASENPQTPAKGDNANPAPFVDLGTNDDEAERQQARRVRRKSIGAITPRSSRRRGSRKSPYLSGRRSNRRPRVIGETELTAMYTKAIHLSQHGKINVKNAWNLELVDHIGDVIKLDTSKRETTDFQRASHTIDAASKIYGVRVDAVYTDTFKVMASMNNQAEGDGESVGLDGNESRRNRRREVGKKTLSNGEMINENIKNLIESVDPLFHKTASAFDEGGARGLLMNQLYVQNGVEIVFDSETKLDKSQEDDAPLSFDEEAAEQRRDRAWIDHLAATILSDTVVDELPENALSQFAPDVGDAGNGEVDLEWINTAEICPLLFEFDRGIKELKQNSAAEQKELENDDLLSPPEHGPDDDVQMDDVGAMNFDDLSLNGGPPPPPQPFDQADDGFAPMDPGDLYDGGPVMDDGGQLPFALNDTIEAQRLEQQMVDHLENDVIDLENVQVVGQRLASSGRDVVGTLSSSLNIMSEMMQSVDLTDLENMTTFFNPKQHGNWAGPDHWHYRRNQIVQAKKNSDGNGGGAEQDDEDFVPTRGGGRKKSKSKSKEHIDFISIGNGEFLDESLFAPPPRSNSCLSAAVLKKHQENFHLLPEDHQLTPRMFARMFLKPQYNVYDHWKMWLIRSKVESQPIPHVLGDSENDGIGALGDGVAGVPGGIDHGDDDDGVRDDFYNYDNANDMLHFVPQSHPIDGLEDDLSDGGGDVFHMFNFGNSEFRMVDEPEKVEKIQINFAVKSKKVDVRRLKYVMWEDISKWSREVSPNNENENPNEENKDEDGTEKLGGVTFQKTINSIADELDGRQVDQLSVSFCFMCLLHLANEKSLSLETTSKALGDFVVKIDGQDAEQQSEDSAFVIE